MTEISASAQNHPVHTPDDVRHYYAGMDNNPLMPGAVPKIGVEIEHTLYKANDLTLPSSRQSESMVARGAQDGIPVHHEPTAACLEIVTDPFTPDDLGTLFKQMESRHDYLLNMIGGEGFTISPFGHMPHLSADDHDPIKNERYEAFWVPPRPDMVEARDFFVGAMNIQASVSPHNRDHLLKIVRMVTALEPLVFLSTSSDAGFTNGQPIKYCLPLYLNMGKGINGGIPDFYYAARSGQEFIENHIDFTLNHPHVFAYFDFDGKLQRLPEGQWVAFNDLERLNLGPRNLINYRQAQSESWRRAINIAVIQNNENHLTSHRAEFASFQTGIMHQRVTAPLMVRLIAFDDTFHEKTKVLLKRYGVDLDNLADCKPVLERNFKNAVYHGNRFSDVAFGTGTLGELAGQLADIVEQCYTGTPFEDHIAPLLHIWRSGRPDWLVYREKLPTLDDVKNYLKNFPAYVQDNPALIDPTSCADWALKDFGQKTRVA